MGAIEQIKTQINENNILLYMKGSPQLPQCGFSSRAVQILLECKKKFAYIDVLANPQIRASLPEHANWPTFPQLWINGELIGGSDIMADLHASGELQKLIDQSIESNTNEESLS